MQHNITEQFLNRDLETSGKPPKLRVRLGDSRKNTQEA